MAWGITTTMGASRSPAMLVRAHAMRNRCFQRTVTLNALALMGELEMSPRQDCATTLVVVVVLAAATSNSFARAHDESRSQASDPQPSPQEGQLCRRHVRRSPMEAVLDRWGYLWPSMNNHEQQPWQNHFLQDPRQDKVTRRPFLIKKR